jgi:hypothetical protein
MTRKSWALGLSTLAMSSGLVALTWAQAAPDTFSQFWGSLYSSSSTAPQPQIASTGQEARVESTQTLAAGRLQQQVSTPHAGGGDMMHHWNRIAIDSSGLDHTPVQPGESRVFGEQLGPGRASRAMAIVHVAIFDAVNAIAKRYRGFTRIPDALPGASMDAAISQAAHDTLVAMFPSQKAHCDELLAEELAAIPDGRAKTEGIRAGQRAARAILARTADDGSDYKEPTIEEFGPSNLPGNWRQDPISKIPIALGAHWGEVTPLVIPSAKRFRVPPPPGMNTLAYTMAYNEAKRLGGDGITTKTQRTEDQTNAAIYWAYDGTPSLCAPPRLYNQIAVQIADQMGLDTVDLARLLAILNVALSDAGIASWESKYYYQVWRPITGIRESDRGTGPTGRGDGNRFTIGDPNFSPLGAPASNLQGPNFTPPFPAYPSGHAVFGGATFQTLRNVFGTDNIPFTFVSDELNGATVDNQGNARPLLPRSFKRLSQAEEENGQSRIYLGIHWSFDKTEGIKQGRRVANYVYHSAFQPRR